MSIILKRRYEDYLDKLGLDMSQPGFETLCEFIVHEIAMMAFEYAQAFFKQEKKEGPRDFGTGSKDFRVHQVGINADNRYPDQAKFLRIFHLKVGAKVNTRFISPNNANRALKVNTRFISPNTGAADKGSDEPGSKNENTQNECNERVVLKANSSDKREILLRTNAVKIVNPTSGKSSLVYAHYDSGSQVTLISVNLKTELGLETVPEPLVTIPTLADKTVSV